MNKPEKPNIIIPESFAENGVKTDFDSNKILNGFDRIQPDVLAGDNLNKFIDDTYKGLNYALNFGDYIDTKVSKSGDTMTGNLNIICSEEFPAISYIDNNFDIASPIAKQLSGMNTFDKNLKFQGGVGHIYTAQGNMSATMLVNREVNGQDVQASITTTISADGKTGYYAGGRNIITDMGKSKSSNGYMSLSNGMIFQWGYSDGSGTRTVTFPTAFSNANPRVYVSHYSNTSRNANARAYSNTATGFTLYCEDGAFWFAIGW